VKLATRPLVVYVAGWRRSVGFIVVVFGGAVLHYSLEKYRKVPGTTQPDVKARPPTQKHVTRFKHSRALKNIVPLTVLSPVLETSEKHHNSNEK